MLWYLIIGVICCITTTLVLYPIHRMIVRHEVDIHDKLVDPIADAAFLEGFDKGWAAAVIDPVTVMDAYTKLFMQK